VDLRDINGDGLPDLLMKRDGDGYFRVRLNLGSGFETTETKWYTTGWGTRIGGNATTSLYGGNDVIGYQESWSTGGGIGGSLHAQYPIPVPFCCVIWPHAKVDYTQNVSEGGASLTLVDINGDGAPDHVYRYSDSHTVYVKPSNVGQANLLIAVNRPLHGRIELSYDRNGNLVDNSDSAHKVDMNSSKWVLSQVVIKDGRGNAYTTHFRYFTSGYYDRAERENYGYAHVQEIRADGAKTDYFYHNQSFTEKGLLYRITYRDSSDRLFERTEKSYTTHLIVPAQNGHHAVRFPALEHEVSYHYEGTVSVAGDLSPGQTLPDGGIRSGVRYTYETTYGNITGYEDEGDLADSGDNASATIVYAHDTQKYIVANPTSITVNGNGKLLRYRTASYDSRGNVTNVSQHIGNRAASTDLTYDQYGNLLSLTGPENYKRQRQILRFVYDDVVHNYVTSVTDDSLDYTSSKTYSYLFGKPLTVTDLNGNVESFNYDEFGRTITIFGPYEQGGTQPTLEFHYYPDAPVPSAQTRHYDRYRDPSGGDTIDTVLFVDGMKRVIQTKKDGTIYTPGKGPQGSDTQDVMIVSGRVVFDTMGRVAEKYYPTTESLDKALVFHSNADDGEPPTRTDYDALDRKVNVQQPDGSITRFDYGLDTIERRTVTTMTDSNGQVSRSYRDVRDLTRKVVENDGTQDLITQYGYDSLKEITSVVDAAGHQTSVTYDELGRRTAIDNPDTGLVEKVYDLAGNVIQKVTPNLRAKKQAITYDYQYTRLEGIHYPNNPANDVSYQYGDDTQANRQINRVGRITRTDHQSGYDEFWYGKLGETTMETRWVHLPGDIWHSGQKHNQGTTQPEEYEVFTTRYQYDTFGRLQNMVYPDGEALTYHYNAGGLPDMVTGSFKGAPYDYVKQVGYDRFGQRVHVAMGNGAVSDYTYDPVIRRLAELRTESLGYRFQDLNYTYDAVGNITDLENSVTPPSDGMGGYVKQHFDYDGLYRLTSANGTYQGDPDSRENYTLTMHYDAIHNITHKTQLDTVNTLSSSGTKQSLSYDWTYAYNPEGKPHAPLHIGERTFSYDANGNQLGWTHDRNATYRAITWDDADRIESVDDHGQVSNYSYDDQGQREIKQARQNLTVYVNQYFTERNGSIGTKNVYVGNTRIVSKVTGGTNFIRSYDGMTGAKQTPPSKANGGTKANNGKAVGKDHSDNGKHLGQEKNSDKASNGKANGKSQGNSGKGQAKTNSKSTSAGGSKTAGVNGIEHRSDRANEVAQNTCKNKHLRDLYCDSNGDGIPDSQEGGSTDDSTTTTSEIVKLGSQGEQLFYYHADHLGSTGYVTRENGEVHEHVQYFPFGETWVQQGGNTEKDPYLFTAKELDEETGLYYFGARYYDPRTSVWVSADPILEKYLPTTNEQGKQNDGEAGGVFLSSNLNLYAYSHQNPVILFDPDGRSVRGDAMIALGYTTRTASWVLQGVNVGEDIITGGAGAADDVVVIPALLELDQMGKAAITAGTLVNAMDKAREKRNRNLGRVYVTYTKTNLAGKVYSGRTSAVVDLTKPIRPQAQAAVDARDASHHVKGGYGPAKMDVYAVGKAVSYSSRYSDEAYYAIRGREQQLIDMNGGAISDGGTSGNSVRGVAKYNPFGRSFHDSANATFGEELAPYSGW